MRAYRIDKTSDRGNIEAIEQAAGAFFEGVDHGAAEPVLRYQRDQRLVGAVIGEHDANQPALAGDRAQRSYAIATPWMRIEAHFDVGRSGIGSRHRLAQEIFGIHLRFADHRADRSLSSDGI